MGCPCSKNGLLRTEGDALKAQLNFATQRLKDMEEVFAKLQKQAEESERAQREEPHNGSFLAGSTKFISSVKTALHLGETGGKSGNIGEQEQKEVCKTDENEPAQSSPRAGVKTGSSKFISSVKTALHITEAGGKADTIGEQEKKEVRKTDENEHAQQSPRERFNSGASKVISSVKNALPGGLARADSTGSAAKSIDGEGAKAEEGEHAQHSASFKNGPSKLISTVKNALHMNETSGKAGTVGRTRSACDPATQANGEGAKTEEEHTPSAGFKTGPSKLMSTVKNALHMNETNGKNGASAAKEQSEEQRGRSDKSGGAADRSDSAGGKARSSSLGERTKAMVTMCHPAKGKAEPPAQGNAEPLCEGMPKKNNPSNN